MRFSIRSVSLPEKELRRARLDIQKTVYEAFDSYREVKAEWEEQDKLIRQYLGKQPVDWNIFELFNKGQVQDVPRDYFAAYSCWQTMIPLEVQLDIIREYLDKHISQLQKLDNRLLHIDARERISKFHDQKYLKEFDELLENVSSDSKGTVEHIDIDNAQSNSNSESNLVRKPTLCPTTPHTIAPNSYADTPHCPKQS